MQKIVLASSNAGKVREITPFFKELKLELVLQSDLGVSDADETGLTFIENALIKARHACEQTGLPAISDDSGLAIDALDGEPGVYSARYAGASRSDNANIDKVLTKLAALEAKTPNLKRTAQFHSVMVLMCHAKDPNPLICHGVWPGEILTAPRGDQGFGYDPIFWVPTHDCSAAELKPEIKQQISHRGQALMQLIARLKDVL